MLWWMNECQGGFSNLGKNVKDGSPFTVMRAYTNTTFCPGINEIVYDVFFQLFVIVSIIIIIVLIIFVYFFVYFYLFIS